MTTGRQQPWQRRGAPRRAAATLLALIFALAPLGGIPAVQAAAYTIADGDVTGLINAVAAAGGGGTTTIALAAGGTYVFAAANNTAVTGANALPVIPSGATVALNGNGALLRRSTVGGTPLFRFFAVASGGSLQIDTLALAGGLVTGGAPGASGNGGAILNNGTLAVTAGTFSGNNAIGMDGAAGVGTGNGGAGGAASGGAISSTGTLTIAASTFSANSAIGGSGGAGNVGGTGGAAGGGAISTGGTATLVNSTFTISTAIGGTGGPSSGSVPGGNGGNATGGAFVSTGGSATLTNATFANNESRGGDGGTGTPDGNMGTGAGGAVAKTGGTFTISTTIVDRNLAGNSQASPYNNCVGLVAANDGGRNLEYIPPVFPAPPPTCGFAAAAPYNDVFADPLLDPLAANGGPTQTAALRAGSAAIDAGGATCPTGIASDQRGQPRPQGAGCDIGAFEYVAPVNPALSNASGSAAGGVKTLSGSGLQMGTVVTIGDMNAPVLSVAANGTTITVSVPARVAGAVAMYATNPGGLRSAAATFTYVTDLTIAGISPASGPAAGGARVTIRGSGFAAPATVTFGTSACAAVMVVDTQTITCTTPPGTGAVNVVVAVPGQSATAQGAYTYGVVGPLPTAKATGAPATPRPETLPSSRVDSLGGSGGGPTPNPLPARR